MIIRNNLMGLVSSFILMERSMSEDGIAEDSIQMERVFGLGKMDLNMKVVYSKIY